jgi:hypothetical protein
MSKPIVVSVPCGSNSVSAGKWVQQDGAGVYEECDDPTKMKGVALTNKNSNNVVGVVKLGLMTLPMKAATYVHGDALELDTTGQMLQALSTGVKVAEAQDGAVIALDGGVLRVLVAVL